MFNIINLLQKSWRKNEVIVRSGLWRLSNEGKIINTGDGLKNLDIEVEVAAITIGQDAPFFEVRESMFDNNSAACKFDISGLLGGR